MPLWLILLILVLLFGAGPVLYGLGIVLLWLVGIPLAILIVIAVIAASVSD
jgi:hypothetical protein